MPPLTLTLFTNARLIDPEIGQIIDGGLLVEDGKITDILTQPVENANTYGADSIIDCAGKYLAPGIIDIGVKVCEPGERHKESFRSAGAAAAAGGVTTTW